MSFIRCHNCEMQFRVSVSRPGEGREYSEYVDNTDILNGTVTCGECGTGNLFRLKAEVIAYRPDRDLFGGLPPMVSPHARTLYEEAIECFLNRTFRASVAMCRATLEQVLGDHGFDKGTLEARIDAAKAAGLLDEEQVTIAHGNRLMGNRALHRASDPHPTQVMGALGALVTIVEHIADHAKTKPVSK